MDWEDLKRKVEEMKMMAPEEGEDWDEDWDEEWDEGEEEWDEEWEEEW
ncbi:hypothetical protein [Candidatus Nanobsidianus stetteri]|jgi:hypothetical protein|uniref:Uncharacterized protein n=1 Tax=Nanobsidianus stetteri TaxID=1294122 RepID=A0AAE3EG39_NANST|nr:hypothetical protein [Candidatus Nanobsidianus stetteri]MCC5447219.1 hypothetical protein [Candidatus Nanobsidianus stetteri]